MNIYMEKIIKELSREESGLELMLELTSYLRKFHRRISSQAQVLIMEIIIEVLARDVELVDPENWARDNFQYYFFSLNNIGDDFINSFKYKLMNRDFSLEDVIGLLECVSKNMDELVGQLDFILRIPELMFKKDLKLRYINEFNPSKAGWMELLSQALD